MSYGTWCTIIVKNKFSTDLVTNCVKFLEKEGMNYGFYMSTDKHSYENLSHQECIDIYMKEKGSISFCNKELQFSGGISFYVPEENNSLSYVSLTIDISCLETHLPTSKQNSSEKQKIIRNTNYFIKVFGNLCQKLNALVGITESELAFDFSDNYSLHYQLFGVIRWLHYFRKDLSEQLDLSLLDNNVIYKKHKYVDESIMLQLSPYLDDMNISYGNLEQLAQQICLTKIKLEDL